MKILKIEFNVSTNRIGSEITEIINLEVDDHLTEQQESDIIEEEYKNWVHEQTDGGWNKI